MEKTLLKNYIIGARYLECVLYFLKFPALGNQKDTIAEALLNEHFLYKYNKKNEVYKIIEDIISDVKDIVTQDFTNWRYIRTVYDIDYSPNNYDNLNKLDDLDYDNDYDNYCYDDYDDDFNKKYIRYQYTKILVNRVVNYNKKVTKLKSILNNTSPINHILYLDENLNLYESNELTKQKIIQNKTIITCFEHIIEEINNYLKKIEYDTEYLNEILSICYGLSNPTKLDILNVSRNILRDIDKSEELIRIYESTIE